MPDTPRGSAACEWCGRAVARNDEGRWYAVKGDERGYDPMACKASDDGRHSPDQPATAACRECGTEADACCADIGYACCWLCTVTVNAHEPIAQEVSSGT